MSDDLVKRLRYGIIEYPKRWSGDTHSDKGGPVDYDATDDLLEQAADRIEELEAQLREAKMQSLPAFGQADEAYKEKLAAEAKLERAVNRLEKLSRWLDLDDEELAAVPIEQLPLDHRHVQEQVNATLEELKSVKGTTND